MSSAKKLQSEIDRVLKAVAEGQEVFEEIWQKVHDAGTPAQKEKFEGDLKTQIKKLQRLREQIKTWISGDSVKDKQPLMDARKRIEQDMERFKVCEKETKTKAYSKDGLAAAANNDPETRAKLQARDWVESCLDSLQTQKDALEAEMEVIRSKQKRGGKSEREMELTAQTERHNYHVERLELVMRHLDNDNLSYDDVNSIKDDVDYYIQSNQDPDFAEDETIYDELGLDDLDNGGMDVLKQTKKEKQEAEKERKEREEAEKEEARKREEARKAEQEKKKKLEEEKRLKEEQRRQAEMERRRQEEERRRQQQELQRKQEEQRRAAEMAKRGPEPAKPAQPPQPLPIHQQQQQPAPAQPPQTQQQNQQQQRPMQSPLQQKSFLSQLRNDKDETASLMEVGASQTSSDFQLSQDALSQDGFAEMAGVNLGIDDAAEAHQTQEEQMDRLAMLEASMKFMPETIEVERPKHLFENQQIFDKLDMDTLFFIFYFQTGSLSQYLAARELKKQGWRFHKKYLTWFQRHEEPVETGHQCERGTYVYFDYETGWCQRIKTDFTFDYYYLEDEVPAQ